MQIDGIRSMREREKPKMTPRLLELELPLMGTEKTTEELLISSLLTPTH